MMLRSFARRRLRQLKCPRQSIQQGDRMKYKSLVLILGSLLAQCALGASAHTLTKKWETDAALKIPESVLVDTKRNVLYVSNVDGEPWADDHKGSIAKVSMDGKILAAEWVKGLRAPKGLGQAGDRLYAADLDEVAVIDIKQGAIVDHIKVPGAKGLNDIAVSSSGTVYVSDSLTQKLHAIKNGKPETLLEGLGGPNGVFTRDGALFLLDDHALYQVENEHTLKKLAGGFDGNADGLERVNATDFVVSCWEGIIYYVPAQGAPQVLLDTRAQKINSADIGYDAQKHLIFVPTFLKNTVVAYELK
jgi:DNA-binding beta-propeller fold protein YncE